jgi:hypothetical protein
MDIFLFIPARKCNISAMVYDEMLLTNFVCKLTTKKGNLLGQKKYGMKLYQTDLALL